MSIKIIKQLRTSSFVVSNFFTPKILYASSHLFLLVIFMNLMSYGHLTTKDKVRSCLTELHPLIFSMFSSSLMTNFAFSIAFWNNPVRGSLIHLIDTVASKTSIGMTVIYHVFFHGLPICRRVCYVITIAFMGWCFYLSNCYSTKAWCCPQHILSHFMAHICAFIAICIAIKTPPQPPKLHPPL